jgi:hypothetical protein
MVLVFILLAYGITNILVYGSIFEPLRDLLTRINPSFLGKLINCPMCTSTWVGFALSALFIYFGTFTPFTTLFNIEYVALAIFLDGCFTSGSVWLLFVLEDYITKEES